MRPWHPHLHVEGHRLLKVAHILLGELDSDRDGALPDLPPHDVVERQTVLGVRPRLGQCRRTIHPCSSPAVSLAFFALPGFSAVHGAFSASRNRRQRPERKKENTAMGERKVRSSWFCMVKPGAIARWLGAPVRYI
jgi:hypothetical protein